MAHVFLILRPPEALRARRRLPGLLTMAVVAALGVAGCGGDGGSTNATNTPGASSDARGTDHAGAKGDDARGTDHAAAKGDDAHSNDGNSDTPSQIDPRPKAKTRPSLDLHFVPALVIDASQLKNGHLQTEEIIIETALMVSS